MFSTRIVTSFAILASCASLSLSAGATVIHSYTGTTYTHLNPSTGNAYDTSMSVSGYFKTSAALLANTVYNFITIDAHSLNAPGIEFSFFDGVNEIKSTNAGWSSNGFDLETDATGAIAYWSFNLIEAVAGQTNVITSGKHRHGGHDTAQLDVSGSNYKYAFTGVTGSWVSTPVATVPEPETYALMLTGLGIMGLVVRRKKRNQAAVA